MNDPVRKMPDLLLPMSKKDYDWHKDFVDYIISTFNVDSFTEERSKDNDNYDLLNGTFDPKQFEYVTNPYGINTPARLVNYPLIRKHFNLMQGELASQPIQFTVDVINRDAVSEKLEKKNLLAAEALLKPIRKQIEQETGIQFEESDQGKEIPQDIQEFINTPFRVHQEETINIGLEYLIAKYNLKREFSRAWTDILTTGKGFCHVQRENIDPVPKIIDPRHMIYPTVWDRNDYEKVSYIGYEMMMNMNEISEMFLHKDLSKEDWEYIQNLRNQPQDYFLSNNPLGMYYNVGSELKVRVVYLQWKALKPIRCKVTENKYDPETPFYKFLEDDYEPKKNDKIVTKYVQWVHCAYKIGHEKIMCWGPKPNQIRYEDNYSDAYYDIVGVINNNINGTTISFVDLAKNIQIMYNIVCYQLEHMLSRAGGKAIIYDISQKPKKMQMTDIVHYAKNHGFIPINTAQEGSMGRTFNQFQSVDFTLSQAYSQVLNYKMDLENMMSNMTGISDARAGINKASDLVGVNERNVMQSSLITAPYFDTYYDLVSQVLQTMANKMSKFWAGQEVMVNILGKNISRFIKIDDSVSKSQYGIFVENTGQDKAKKDMLMPIVDRYSQSGAIGPEATVKAISESNFRDIEKIIIEGAQRIEKLQQAQQQQAQQVEQQKAQVDQQKLDQNMQIAQLQSDTQRYVADKNNETKLIIKNKDQDFEAEKFDEESQFGMDQQMLDHQNRMSEYAMQNSINQTERDISAQENGGNVENNL